MKAHVWWASISREIKQKWNRDPGHDVKLPDDNKPGKTLRAKINTGNFTRLYFLDWNLNRMFISSIPGRSIPRKIFLRVKASDVKSKAFAEHVFVLFHVR